MTNKEIFEALKAPFKPEEVEWRLAKKSKDGTKGSVLAYIDSRAIQERLDEVVSPENWTVRYSPTDLGNISVKTYSGEVNKSVIGFLAELTIKLPDGSTVSRQDGGNCTDFEPFKGGISGAFKRVASVFGIGRYLYGLTETWVPIDKWGKFTKPQLPEWALPEGYEPKASPQAPEEILSDEYFESFGETGAVQPEQPDMSTVQFAGGKYGGRAVNTVTDYGYLRWVVDKSTMKPEIKMAAKAVLDANIDVA